MATKKCSLKLFLTTEKNWLRRIAWKSVRLPLFDRIGKYHNEKYIFYVLSLNVKLRFFVVLPDLRLTCQTRAKILIIYLVCLRHLKFHPWFYLSIPNIYIIITEDWFECFMFQNNRPKIMFFLWSVIRQSIKCWLRGRFFR